MPAQVQCSIRGDRRFRARMTQSAPAMLHAVGIALEQHADQTIAWIGNHESSLFTNPSGNLIKNLVRDSYVTRGTRVSVKSGWNARGWYGKILEHGPKDKGPKPILPGKGIAVSGPREGQPTIALRWVGKGGAVVYRRRSTYLWTESMRRRHWKKATDALAGARRGGLRRAVKAALEGIQ